MDRARLAKFSIGQVVKHRIFPFRGVVFDVDPVFNNTEEWWLAIPEEIRPAKDQPYYHLFAENADSEYIAYVSEQNLLPDESEEPLRKSMSSSPPEKAPATPPATAASTETMTPARRRLAVTAPGRGCR